MHVPRNAILVTTCLLGTILVGCTTNERARSGTTNNVGVSQAQVRSEIAGAQVQVDATTDSLENLISAQDEATLPKRYQLFVQSLDALEQQRDQLSERADDMLDRQEEYLATWRGSLEGIQNPQLRQSSRERLDTLSRQFSEVREQLVEAEYAMQPMIRTMTGIETSLSYDLSMQNLENVSQALDEESLNRDQIDQALSEAKSQIDELNKVAELR